MSERTGKRAQPGQKAKQKSKNRNALYCHLELKKSFRSAADAVDEYVFSNLHECKLRNRNGIRRYIKILNKQRHTNTSNHIPTN